MKILIAEDDPISRLVLQDLIDKYGSNVAVEDGEQCLSAFHKALEEGTPYDLLILDISMPKLTGHEVLTKVRLTEQEQNLNKTVVFISTGDHDYQTMVNSFEGNCDAYLLKPVNEQKIEETLREHFPEQFNLSNKIPDWSEQL